MHFEVRFLCVWVNFRLFFYTCNRSIQSEGSFAVRNLQLPVRKLWLPAPSKLFKLMTPLGMVTVLSINLALCKATYVDVCDALTTLPNCQSVWNDSLIGDADLPQMTVELTQWLPSWWGRGLAAPPQEPAFGLRLEFWPFWPQESPPKRHGFREQSKLLVRAPLHWKGQKTELSDVKCWINSWQQLVDIVFRWWQAAEELGLAGSNQC